MKKINDDNIDYSILPAIRQESRLELPHFPSRFHCAVFRLWETVSAQRMAEVFGISLEKIYETAQSMGLPEQKFNPDWETLGYITTLRNAWHILPYGQLLGVLGWDDKKLASVLKEDDFLSHKLGFFKPYCEDVVPEKLSAEGMKRLEKIKQTVQTNFSDLFGGAVPFDFFRGSETDTEVINAVSDDGIRMIFSYCGLYASVLENDISISFPEEMLAKYKKMGVNAIWIHSALYQLVPFTFDESYSEGWQERQERLRTLIALADKYSIKVYIYINEPRCMPLPFFDKHPELSGRYNKADNTGSLCTSVPAVLEYLRYAVRKLCTDVPGLGGFFAITCSENLTHCKSRTEGVECERCKDVPISKLISDVLTAVSEESRAVDPDIKLIAWTWGWDYFMSPDDIRSCIASIPKEIIIQTNSEASKPYCIGGIDGEVRDYSISIPGPSDVAKRIWQDARNFGHETSAKVQINNTWECSTVPYLPVFDLIREHMTGLYETGVKHLMLSWTLGGYPSVSLKIASECIKTPSEEKYIELLKEEYGEYAETVKRAAKIFSDAFREFPFDIITVYMGPQNPGPANLLYAVQSGFNATMTCYAYDDLDSWRSIYPREVFIDQLKKLSKKWEEGLEVIKDMPDCEFKDVALGGYLLFYSSYLQSEFCDKRDTADKEYLISLAEKEKENAYLMYGLMSKNNRFGYEAANHYYFNKGSLMEKVINCEYVKEYFEINK